LLSLVSIKNGLFTSLLSYQPMYLQDDVWGNAVLLKEANAISVELKKKARFSHCFDILFVAKICYFRR